MFSGIRALASITFYPVLILVVFGGIPIFIWFLIESSRSNYFEKIEIGTKREKIIERYGKPKNIEKCKEMENNNFKNEIKSECSEILMFGFINTYYFNINKEGYLISKSRGTSE